MAKKSTSLLYHGFKADAERKALELRVALDIPSNGRLCAFKLAQHLGLPIYSHLDCSGVDRNKRYEDWSALLTPTKDEGHAIVYNAHHSSARQQSDIMHEIAHFLRQHPFPEELIVAGKPLQLPIHNPVHEEEAKWLGATLQLPRGGLVYAVSQSMSPQEIAEFYTASLHLVRMRLNSLGLHKRLSM